MKKFSLMVLFFLNLLFFHDLGSYMLTMKELMSMEVVLRDALKKDFELKDEIKEMLMENKILFDFDATNKENIVPIVLKKEISCLLFFMKKEVIWKFYVVS